MSQMLEVLALVWLKFTTKNPLQIPLEHGQET